MGLPTRYVLAAKWQITFTELLAQSKFERDKAVQKLVKSIAAFAR